MRDDDSRNGFIPAAWLNEAKPLIMFGLVGIVGAGTGAAIYAALVWAGAHYIVASVTGFLLSVPVGYWLNRKLTFQSGSAVRRSFPRVVLIYVTQQGLMIAGLALLVDALGIGPILAYVIAAPPCIAFSYLAMKFYGFR